jgi:hypothetical protein
MMSLTIITPPHQDACQTEGSISLPTLLNLFLFLRTLLKNSCKKLECNALVFCFNQLTKMCAHGITSVFFKGQVKTNFKSNLVLINFSRGIYFYV